MATTSYGRVAGKHAAAADAATTTAARAADRTPPHAASSSTATNTATSAAASSTAAVPPRRCTKRAVRPGVRRSRRLPLYRTATACDSRRRAADLSSICALVAARCATPLRLQRLLAGTRYGTAAHWWSRRGVCMGAACWYNAAASTIIIATARCNLRLQIAPLRTAKRLLAYRHAAAA